MASNKDKVADSSATTNKPVSVAESTSLSQAPLHTQIETDDFGLPIRRCETPTKDDTSAIASGTPKPTDRTDAAKSPERGANKENVTSDVASSASTRLQGDEMETSSLDADAELGERFPDSDSDSDVTAFEDAQSVFPKEPVSTSTYKPADLNQPARQTYAAAAAAAAPPAETTTSSKAALSSTTAQNKDQNPEPDAQTTKDKSEAAHDIDRESGLSSTTEHDTAFENPTAAAAATNKRGDDGHAGQIQSNHRRGVSAVSAASIGSASNPVLSEFSHQQLSTQSETEKEEKEDDDDGWQTMPAFAPYDMYDDDNRLIAREHNVDEEDKDAYAGLGGAGKGYTRVIMDDDVESITSMDDNTQYLFKDTHGTGLADEEGRDAVSQMQATKDLLTEGQRIAYVGVVRLEIARLVTASERTEITKKTKKETTTSAEALKMWGQKMMIRLYTHMDISEAEQLMIEQLAEHGVVPKDLTPALHANSRVNNPMAEDRKSRSRPSSACPSPGFASRQDDDDEKRAAELPPPYESTDQGGELPAVQTPSQLPTTDKIDIDLRWTVLCDLFLILIADSVYDARSRVLLERVAESLEISWIDICRFEKRVTDALEMQQAAEKENWNEDEHMESRRKLALTQRYVMMGLATVGGGLVIGLSAGLLAPVIGAGLAAGFTTIGVTGTSSFLAGAGGAAIITSSAAASGSLIGGRAANRRTGSVKTFEYRPLHNNKRVNLIVTVSGWLTGKVDDVRLPFSTVDPIMGDMYSVYWEPEMLRSMGDTINILATEALTQGLQQILGSTILVSLMAALQLPIVLTKLSYLIDNPWAVSLDRATAAGLILADSLMDRSLGTRPVTLVGYSIGARVIFSCLQELSKRGAYGLVQNVYLFGSPVVVKTDEFLRARTVVAGRFVNGYNRNDWILGYLFRLTNGGIRRVAGLAPVDEVPWLENMDVTDQVAGHMQYRAAMPVLLKKCGWVVESEVFTEIEDPDPENHDERQRELINEIEEARKELDKEGNKKKSVSRFSLFGRRKKAERAEWEVYEDSAAAAAAAAAAIAAGTKDVKSSSSNGKLEDKSGNNHGVLFDIDAIRAELAKESYDNADAETALQIKEIKSTLPPMKLDISPPTTRLASSSSSHLVVGAGVTGASVTGASLGDGRLGGHHLRETKSSADIWMTSNRGFESANADASPWGESLSYHGVGRGRDDDQGREEGEVEMIFDTSFDDATSSHTYATLPADRGSLLSRPEMKTARTAPTMALADPWADIDDEDFGKEQEISMTFA
ncbi:hypothetical protein E4U21_000344 [Claviceps maximensis]|nr:hypothetical protein E4U21_000344 [Claviceps maximensis]